MTASVESSVAPKCTDELEMTVSPGLGGMALHKQWSGLYDVLNVVGIRTVSPNDSTKVQKYKEAAGTCRQANDCMVEREVLQPLSAPPESRPRFTQTACP